MHAVTACDEGTGEVNDVADVNLFEVFCLNWRREDFFTHSVTPLCERTS